MSVKAIRNHIIFQFENDIVREGAGGNSHFKEETEWGFDLGKGAQTFDSSSKEAQWGIITGIGPEVNELKVANRILIEPLKWTAGIEVDGIMFWRTDETCVMAVDTTV